MLTRRSLLAGVAPAGVALAVAGCSTAQLTTLQQQWSDFVDQVNAILAVGCSTVLPAFTVTASTVEAIVNILYPGVGAAVSGIAGAVQVVASKLCSMLPVAQPPAPVSSAAKARRLALGPAVAPVIGTVTVNGMPIAVNGYIVPK